MAVLTSLPVEWEDAGSVPPVEQRKFIANTEPVSNYFNYLIYTITNCIIELDNKIVSTASANSIMKRDASGNSIINVLEVAGFIKNSKTLSIPTITAADTLALLDFTQTLKNKTINTNTGGNSIKVLYNSTEMELATALLTVLGDLTQIYAEIGAVGISDSIKGKLATIEQSITDLSSALGETNDALGNDTFVGSAFYRIKQLETALGLLTTRVEDLETIATELVGKSVTKNYTIATTDTTGTFALEADPDNFTNIRISFAAKGLTGDFWSVYELPTFECELNPSTDRTFTAVVRSVGGGDHATIVVDKDAQTIAPTFRNSSNTAIAFSNAIEMSVTDFRMTVTLYN